MRFPNGYGSVTKLSGKRRNPYMVRITIGVDEDTGEFVRKVLGYYHTRKDALEALAEYNKNPYDLSAHAYTFAEVYEMWRKKHAETVSSSMMYQYQASYKALHPLHDMPFKDLRLIHLQQAVDESGKSENSKVRMKGLLIQLYTFALRHEITDKDYSHFVEASKPTEQLYPHTTFESQEIDALWAAVGKVAYADTILILIYSGMRAGELLGIRRENVHLEEKYMVGGSKTAAGKNRIIPIHDKVMPLVQARFMTSEEYLIEPKLEYDAYQYQFKKVMTALSMTHRTHDCRHTFASLMDTAGANTKAIKTIMGHSGGDLTSKIYIHKSLPELLKNINMIH